MHLLKSVFMGFVLTASCGLAACASVTERGAAAIKSRGIKKEASYALSRDADTSLRRFLAEDVAANAGQSGFRVFEKGANSLYARLALMQAAEKTIDLQYYAVADDATSNLMIEAIIRAARRGVRVRMLVDGFTLSKISEELAAFDGLQGIEVRVFNPVGFANENILTRAAHAVGNAGQVNRRMHNKLLIADSQMAILGGRNLGDEYFDAHSDVSFKDIDILAAGPIIADMARSFDDYWNDISSYPLEAVEDTDVSRAEKVRQKIADNWDRRIGGDRKFYNYDRPVADIFRDERINLIWANAKFVADDPFKVTGMQHEKSPPLRELLDIASEAEKEFAVVSSYFVPMETGVAWLGRMHDRGVSVRVLTNSLASTDVVAVHSGYQAYRKDLLKRGVKLYEFKPVNRERKQRLLARTAPPKAGLHAKLYIVDARYVLVGSFNLDPRSANLNTELMLLIDSPEIAVRLMRSFEQAISPESSYALSLDTDGEIIWTSREKDGWRRERAEPAAGVGRRIQNFLFSLFPLDKNL